MRSLGYPAEGPAHLDPDLIRGRRARRAGWRGAFGQVGAAASHLLRQDVGAGDLFLFFGLFRRAEGRSAGYRFVRGERPFHAIWGYLQVDRRLDAADPAPAWARDHAHFADPGRGRPNVVFLAAGFGLFRYREQLRLTRHGASRVTDWRLPVCFADVELTYHPRRAKGRALRAASRGQEFVCERKPSVAEWARSLISESERWSS